MSIPIITPDASCLSVCTDANIILCSLSILISPKQTLHVFVPVESYIPRSLKGQFSGVSLSQHSILLTIDTHLHTIATLHLKGNIISCVCTHRYSVSHLIIRIILIMRCIFSLGSDFRIHRKPRLLSILVPLCQSPNNRKYDKHCYQNKKYRKYRTHHIK